MLVHKYEVDEDWKFVLKLSDMGLARHVPQSSAPVSITGYVGTSGWQAPEVIMLVEDTEATYHYSFPADVFASGLVFLTLVTHQRGENLRPLAGM